MRTLYFLLNLTVSKTALKNKVYLKRKHITTISGKPIIFFSINRMRRKEGWKERGRVRQRIL